MEKKTRNSYVPITRFFNSAIIRRSISHAITFLAFSIRTTVKLPVPDPTSKTVSDALIADCKLVEQFSALMSSADIIPSIL